MKKINLILAAFILGLLSLTLASADIGDCPMGGMMYGSYGSGMMFFSWITYLLVITLIIAAIYWLVKSAGRK